MKFSKIFSFFLTDKKTVSLKTAVLALSVSLIPIILLGFFCTPGADDYGCGAFVHLAWKETHSLFAVVEAIFRQASHFYNMWQGTFGSSVLMSLSPAFFNIHLSFLVPVLLLFLCIGSTLLLFTELLGNYLNCKKMPAASALLFLLMSLFQVMQSPRDGIYWYNGAIHYMGMQSLFFFSLFLSSKLLRADKMFVKIILTLILAALCLLTGGANLVTALQAVIVYTVILISGVISKKKETTRLLFPSVLLYLGFLLNVIAPGNHIRGKSFSSLNPIAAIAKSFLAAGNYLIEWLNPLILLTFILILPLLWHMVKESSYNFRYPLLPFSGSLCLYSAMFTPSLYATGSVGADRQLNMIQWTFYLLLFFNLVYLLGYIAKYCSENAPAFQFMSKVISPAGSAVTLFGLVGICFVLLFTADRTTYTSIAAARSLINGEAACYHDEYMQRLSILEDEAVSDAVVTPFSVYPDLLTSEEDFSSDPMDWLNITGSRYFDKKTIVMKE